MCMFVTKIEKGLGIRLRIKISIVDTTWEGQKKRHEWTHNPKDPNQQYIHFSVCDENT